MCPAPKGGVCYVIMNGLGNHHRGLVDRIEQTVELIERPHAKLLRHRRRALRARFEKTDEPRTRHVAQDPYVMIPERTSANDTDADLRLRCHDDQITSPRSLRSKKLKNSSTSG